MSYVINGEEKETDEYGFLLEPDFSDEAVQVIAEAEGIALTDDHMTVINYFRDQFREEGKTTNFRNFMKSYILRDVFRHGQHIGRLSVLSFRHVSNRNQRVYVCRGRLLDIAQRSRNLSAAGDAHRAHRCIRRQCFHLRHVQKTGLFLPPDPCRESGTRMILYWSSEV